MNNYFIIHGSFSTPFSNWFGWLFNEIKNEYRGGVEPSIYCPQFPIGVGLQNYKNWETLLKYYADLGLINENTIIFAHSIAPIFVTKFLINNKIKVKRLVFVCGFNNYLGINEEYDAVNNSMYCENMEDVKNYCKEIICFYTNNDPYVPLNKEKEFADAVATKKILIDGGGHLNAEKGYTQFKELKKYI